MDQATYNKCIGDRMRGKKFSPEERKLQFCVSSKVCSKGISEGKAKTICSLPKEPKLPKARKLKKGQTCEKEVLGLTKCIIGRIDMDKVSNINTLQTALTNAMMECQCRK